jgi:hypothetical protein
VLPPPRSAPAPVAGTPRDFTGTVVERQPAGGDGAKVAPPAPPVAFAGGPVVERQTVAPAAPGADATAKKPVSRFRAAREAAAAAAAAAEQQQQQ